MDGLLFFLSGSSTLIEGNVLHVFPEMAQSIPCMTSLMDLSE
jgi:hypothetical protein